MATTWEKVHIFVSSPFSDMHPERDYLVKRVFPDLREWCARRKLRLVDIDLRWGVTEHEAAYNKNVVKFCFRAIDVCRPFFVCFLGQRFGTTLCAEDISRETYAEYPGLKAAARGASVTALEVMHAVISPFSHGQGGSPESAEHAFFYFRDSSYLDQLPAEPAQIRHIYADDAEPDSVRRNERLGRLQRLKEQIAATGRPISNYQVKWREEDRYRTPEVAMPLASPSALPAQVREWQDEWRRFAGIEVQAKTIAETSPEFTKAQAYLALLTRGRLADFTCTVPGCAEALPLGQVIAADLKKAIQEHFPDHIEVPVADDLQLELDQQEEFLFNQRQAFVQRPGDFDALNAYVTRPEDHRVFVLVGDAGAGKSSLLAEWVDSGPLAALQGGSVHFRSIGASDRSASVDDLLRFLLHELQESGKLEDEIPEDPAELRRAWVGLLEAASRHGGPMLIIIDGLNQLETGMQDLTWFPETLPDNLKLVVSCQTHWRDVDNDWVAQVPPFNERADRRKLVDAYLQQYSKQMDEAAVRDLVSFPGASNPLFLKVVLSESLVLGTFADVHAKIRHAFGDNPVSAFDGILERLETDSAYTSLDQTRVVPLLFGFLACARAGLSVEELSDLVARHYPWPDGSSSGDLDDAASLQAYREEAADAINLCLRQVRPFLARRGGRVDFFYDSFKIAAVQRYQTEPTTQTPMNRQAAEWHKPLAEMFHRLSGLVDPSASTAVMYDVYLDYDLKAALPAVATNPQKILIGVFDIFREILGVDIHRAGDIVDELYRTQSSRLARLSAQQAMAVAAEFERRGMPSRVVPVVEQAEQKWASTTPRHFSELLFHQFECGQLDKQADALVDDAFRTKYMAYHGPGFFVKRFAELLDRLNKTGDEQSRSILTDLRLRIPTNNEFYRRFLRELSKGLEQDLEQTSAFLAVCASDPEQHERASIGLRALKDVARIKLNCRVASVQDALSRSALLLLESAEKRTRWETVHAYWTLLPKGDTGPLLLMAESESEHPLIRAEAARQLAASDDASVVSRLLRLAQTQQFPLNWMADYAARSIQLSCRLIEPGSFDERRTFPAELPPDTGNFLKSLGAESQDLGEDLWKPETRLLLHITSPSELSVEANWEEVRILEQILRRLPCTVVCIEAGVGDDSLAFLRKFSHSEHRLRVSARYFHDLILHGHEFLDLNTDLDYDVLGVEHIEIYKQMVREKNTRMGKAVGLAGVASVARAKYALDQTLEVMNDLNLRVCVLITSELPGYQISRLLGEEWQYMRLAAQEAVDLDAAVFGTDNSFLESLLPETVAPNLVHKPDNLAYVMLHVNQPTGDLFEADINYVHAGVEFQSAGPRQAQEEAVASREAEILWRPDEGSLKGADLTALDFSAANLEEHDFTRSNLAWSRLVGANLSGAKLGGANLRGADLSYAVMTKASCRAANLFQATLTCAELRGADLRHANAYEARFEQVDLLDSRLDDAVLFAASFKGADLSNASLRRSDARKADFSGAILTGAHVKGARFDGARYDGHTRWPARFDPIRRGAVFIEKPIMLRLPSAAAPMQRKANEAVREICSGDRVRGQLLLGSAIEYWEHKLGPDSPGLAESLNAVVRALQEQYDDEAALPLCRRCVEIWNARSYGQSPSFAVALNNIGLSEVRLGRFEEAESHLVRAREIDPTTPNPLYWLAILYRQRARSGDEAQEVAAWRRYLELGATSEEREQEARARLSDLGVPPE